MVEPDGPPAGEEYNGPRLVGGRDCGQNAQGSEQDEPDDDRQRPGDGSDNDGRSRGQGDGQGGPAGSVQPGPSEAAPAAVRAAYAKLLTCPIAAAPVQ